MDFLHSVLDILKFVRVYAYSIIYITKYKLFGEKRVSDEENIYGKVVVITGASKGIGKATASEFAKRGAIVVMADVDLKEGEKSVQEIKNSTGNENVELIYLDLSEMESVRKFAATVKEKYPDIKILFNNAGIIPAISGNHTTKDGFNVNMAVNYLGHFLLTNLLLENLKRGAPARVVGMSSTLQVLSRLDLNDLMMLKSSWGITKALPYHNSKVAVSLFVKELGKRLKGSGITTYAIAPGPVRTTIWNDAPTLGRIGYALLLKYFGFSAEQAAEAVLYSCLSKSVAKESGLVYHCKRHFTIANKRLKSATAEQLWNITSELVQLNKISADM